MICTLVESFVFDAAHRLAPPTVPVGHKCTRVHGHTFRVELHVTGVVDPKTYIFINYDNLVDCAQRVIRELDHQFLNDIPGLQIPTTEALCVWIWTLCVSQRLFDLSKVVVREGATSRCEYDGQ